ncbi:MAG: tRNA (adenosine(37)-N6)-dimethylallyltransferase MiaA [Bifidobacteriaceae bacterium]|nr:tRNA (adenosine(37)-N6)-dimethylallyltransferase MiaA [Bifidobacteriaceae bacterium]
MVGPTATGKSALALDLAEALDGEIVNADAMALYKGMEIGTARTPVKDRRGIPHHQLDVLEVTEEASVATYQREARADIEQIWGRGKAAILVGGSGLYVRAVTDQIDFPGTDPVVRRRWEELGQAKGPEHLHHLLQEQDPAAAQAILPGNLRRLVRALEVIEITGRPFSAHLPAYTPWRPLHLVGLDLDNNVLDQRISQRATAMMAAGLVEEAARLADQGLRAGKTASRAIGYSQALAVLDGLLDLGQATDQIALATRQLSRRQRKWFRRDPRITWLDGAGQSVVDQALAVLG